MADPNLYCANCNQLLDPTDKFCRECGLPTMRRAQAQAAVPALSPNTEELQRALDATVDPRPFIREEAGAPTSPADKALGHTQLPVTTGDVVRVTNPTFAANLASSTTLMVGIIVVLAVSGIVMIVLALRP
jgi:hypothetical protein